MQKLKNAYIYSEEIKSGLSRNEVSTKYVKKNNRRILRILVYNSMEIIITCIEMENIYFEPL